MRDLIKKTISMIVILTLLLTFDGCLRQSSKDEVPSDDQNSTITQSQESDQTESVTILSTDDPNEYSSQSLESDTVTEETQPQESEPAPETTSEPTSEPSKVVEISEAEQIMLLKLAFAEAGNQDVDGKALVMLVVLNRVKSDEFPDTIYGVIHQSRPSIQFSPVASGSYDRATASDPGCLEALELVIQGYDISQGATYFESVKSKDSWHYRNLNFLFEHGGHWFYN